MCFKIFEANNILESMTPITILMQFLGFPYHIEKKKNSDGYEFKLTPLYVLIFSCGSLAFWWSIYQFYTTKRAAFIDTVAKGLIFVICDRFNLFSNFVVLSLIYTHSLRDIKCYPKVALILTDVENLWKPLGIIKEYRQVKKSQMIPIIGQSFTLFGQMISTVVLMSYWKDQLMYFELFAMFMPGYECSMLLTVYCIFIFHGITLNCRIISSELEFIYEKSFSGKADVRALFLNVESTKLRRDLLLKDLLESSSRDEVIFDRLTQYWKLYDRICDYTDSLNEIFSFKVAMILGISFVSMIVNLFITLSAAGWMTKGGEKAFFLLSYSLTMSSIHFINLILTVGYVHSCQKSVHGVAVLINKLMTVEQNPKVLTKLHNFSTHMLQRRPEFVPLGLFGMDNSFLFAIAGSATTFLIILAQFYIVS